MADRQERRDLVVARVLEADPDLARAAILEAIAEVANDKGLQVLADALAAGAAPLHTGAPDTVRRLVVALIARGSALAEPVCSRCAATGRKLVTSDEGALCPRCRRRHLSEVCAVCAVTKPVAHRDATGAGVCARCAPRPMRICSRCGETRVIARRARDGEGDLCQRCYRAPVADCGVCGRRRPCHFVSAGRPICLPCSPRSTSACAHCSAARPACVRWPEGPVCEPCYRAALSRRGRCDTCGAQRRLVHPPGPGASRCAGCAGVADLARCRSCGADERPYRHGLCVRCALAERVDELFAGAGGPLAVVRAAILAAPQPYSTHNWLRSSASAAILADLSAGRIELSHEALDAHPRPGAVAYLREVLVAHGVLPERDEALVRLESWVTDRLGELSSECRPVLVSYARWRVLRRVRQRAQAKPRPATPVGHAKNCLNAAVSFASFLDTRHTRLIDTTQADMEEWTAFTPDPALIADFVDWASGRGHLPPLVVPSRQRRDGPAMAADERFAIARRLLHDDELEVSDRVAGCLVLLYGQPLSRIVALTRDRVVDSGDGVSLLLGATRIELPDPLAGLVRNLSDARRPKNSVVTTPDRGWLFPGRNAARPLNAAGLGARLRTLGVRTMPGRRGALVHLAARLPAAALADLLGITPGTAVRWVAAGGGDWSSYAADVARSRGRAG